MAFNFLIGDHLVYPLHGAGVVQSKEEKTVLGSRGTYLVIYFPLTRTTLLLPEDHPNTALRLPATLLEIKEGFRYLTHGDSSLKLNDRKSRLKHFEENLKDGHLPRLFEVVYQCHLLKTNGSIGVTEDHLYDQAMDLIASELSMTLQKTPEEVRTGILEILEFGDSNLF